MLLFNELFLRLFKLLDLLVLWALVDTKKSIYVFLVVERIGGSIEVNLNFLDNLSFIVRSLLIWLDSKDVLIANFIILVFKFFFTFLVTSFVLVRISGRWLFLHVQLVAVIWVGFLLLKLSHVWEVSPRLNGFWVICIGLCNIFLYLSLFILLFSFHLVWIQLLLQVIFYWSLRLILSCRDLLFHR